MIKKIILFFAFALIVFTALSQISGKPLDNLNNLKTSKEEQDPPKQIEIVYAGTLTLDEEKYPGATIFNSDDVQQVQFKHQGLDLWCDIAILYREQNLVKAYGKVFLQQGDSIKMDSDFIQYDGNTKIATAKENVTLRNNSMTLETQELVFDRNTQEVYYPNNGKITDNENILTSKNGKYFVQDRKSRFVEDVQITNPHFVLKSSTLDYYHNTGYAYLLGKSTIEGKDYTVYTEKGFYDTKIEQGYFNYKPQINYDNKIIVGDSIYFDKAKSFSSAVNRIKITDTINKVVVRGNYAEVYKDKDSVFIEKKAIVSAFVEQDSIYIHGKRILVTGKKGHRVIRAYPNARMYKTDMQGKCDSINSDQATGITKLVGRPVMWNGNNQVTGDNIHIISDVKTEKVDSLKVFNNAFIIEKDSLGNGYNQVIGKVLYGKFVDNKLKRINLLQNTQVIYYAYDDKNQLVGINKTKCSRIQVFLDKDQKMDKITFYNNVDGNIYPLDKFPKKEALFPGFEWREEERIGSKEEVIPKDEE